MNFGLIQSKLTGDEQHFYTTQPVGAQYTCSVGEAYNQGQDPICAACAVSTFLEWNYGKTFNPWQIYKEAGGNNGISFKKILAYLKEKGLIKQYALVHSEQALKTAIRVNGPCLGALNVYNSNSCNFWDGGRYEGGHGVSIIGWNNDNFIIRNSWGRDWCKQGNTILPSNRFNLFLEIWTMIA